MRKVIVALFVAVMFCASSVVFANESPVPVKNEVVVEATPTEAAKADTTVQADVKKEEPAKKEAPAK